MDLIDPRHDPEPPYWENLRRRAGLRADWSYDLLRIAAWTAPAPLLLTTIRDRDEVVAVICASWQGPRRRSYVHTRPRLGALYVQSPGTSAVPGWWFAEHLTTADRATLCRDYLRRMRRELGPRCRGVVWRHAAGQDLAMLRTGQRGLLRPTDAVAVLPLRWSTADQWLDSLGSSRRKDLRRQRRHLDADPDLMVTFGPASTADPVPMGRLLRWNEDKYTDRHAGLPVATAYLSALLRREDAVTLTYTDHTGRPLAFCVILDHPTCPVPRIWASMPHHAGGRRHLYFDMILRTVDWAVRTGREEVNYGRGKLPLKHDLGSELRPRYSVAVPCR